MQHSGSNVTNGRHLSNTEFTSATMSVVGLISSSEFSISETLPLDIEIAMRNAGSTEVTLDGSQCESSQSDIGTAQVTPQNSSDMSVEIDSQRIEVNEKDSSTTAVPTSASRHFSSSSTTDDALSMGFPPPIFENVFDYLGTQFEEGPHVDASIDGFEIVFDGVLMDYNRTGQIVGEQLEQILAQVNEILKTQLNG